MIATQVPIAVAMETAMQVQIAPPVMIATSERIGALEAIAPPVVVVAARIESATGKSQAAVLPEVTMHSVARAEAVGARLGPAARADLPASVVLEVVAAVAVGAGK